MIDIPLTNELSSGNIVMLQISSGLQTSSGQTCVTPLTCTCNFFAMNQLPCRHMFALRKHLSLDLYFEEAVAQRWRIEFYQNSVLTGDSDSCFPGPVPVIQPKERVLSVSQRYKVANIQAQKLAVLTSETFMEKYKSRLLVLQNLVQIWEQDHEVTVSDSTATMNNSFPIEEPGALQEGGISKDQRLVFTDSGESSISAVECEERDVDLHHEEITMDEERTEHEDIPVDLVVEESNVNLEHEEIAIDLLDEERNVDLGHEEITARKERNVDIVNIKVSILALNTSVTMCGELVYFRMVHVMLLHA